MEQGCENKALLQELSTVAADRIREAGNKRETSY